MQSALVNILDRTIQIRRQLEHQRRQPGAPLSRLLRLQALLLGAQRRLAELIEPAVARPVLVLAQPSRR